MSSVLRSAGVLAIVIAGVALAPVAASAQTAPATKTATPAVTFAKDIAPIFQKSCQGCHRPGQMAPMSLLTYQDVRPWAKSIKQKVQERQMPPWGIDPHVGLQSFKNDPSLRDDEIEKIAKWVDSGAPMGNLTDMPKPREWDDSDRWHIGKPDVIVTSPPHKVPAEAADWWGSYYVTTGLTEDRYIKAIESKPGKTAVVHHLLTYAVDADVSGDSNGDDSSGDAGEFLNEFAVGKNGDLFPEGTGRLLKAVSKIKFDMHYSSIDHEVTDRPMVGFKFYPKGYEPPNKVVRLNWASLGDLDLPVGEANARSDGYTVINHNFRLMTYLPHMHIRGKRQCIELIYPTTGRVEPINCFNFNFMWQNVFQYDLDSQPLIPAGTILHVINYHDNSAGNRLNPDPKNWVGFGQRTVDDMAIAMGEGMKLTDEQFQQAVKERQQKQKQQNGRSQ